MASCRRGSKTFRLPDLLRSQDGAVDVPCPEIPRDCPGMAPDPQWRAAPPRGDAIFEPRGLVALPKGSLRNGRFTPADVKWGASIRVWWKCKAGPDHEWQAPVSNRTRFGLGCPFCAGRRLSVTNSFAARYPKIAAQWHPTLKGRRRPEQFLSRAR